MHIGRYVEVFLFTAILPERKCKDKTPGGTTYQTGEAVDLFILFRSVFSIGHVQLHFVITLYPGVHEMILRHKGGVTMSYYFCHQGC